jgi:hypothetical protein
MINSSFTIKNYTSIGKDEGDYFGSSVATIKPFTGEDANHSFIGSPGRGGEAGTIH